MKKLLSIIICITLILATVIPALAESKLSQYEELLTGEWEQIRSFDANESHRIYNYSSVLHFVYPAPAEPYDLDTSSYPEADYLSVVYNLYLTEDATGQIYLIIDGKREGKGYKYIGGIGSISFSKDGNTLLILPTNGRSMALYKRIK